ncbi:MAG: hypothetical protein ACREFY_10345, partial [Acetobacteraceae bacterium]
MTPAELRALLVDCLALWDAAGRVEADGDGAAVVTAAGRCVLRPAEPAMRPIRWLVATPERAAVGRGPRPAASLAAALQV